MHSLSGFEASQVPDAIIGMEHMNAKKFKKAVRLLLKDMMPLYALSFLDSGLFLLLGIGSEKDVLFLVMAYIVGESSAVYLEF